MVYSHTDIARNGPDRETLKPNVKPNTQIPEPNVKPGISSSSVVSATTFNEQSTCKAAAGSATKTAHGPLTFNRFDCLIQSPIMC